jgi:gluconate kinase
MWFYCPKLYCKKIFIILQIGILISLLGCSGQEKSERDRLREQNAKGEYIYRLHDEVLQAEVGAPKHRERELYPWEE